MRLVRTALELGVELNAYIEVILLELDCLDKSSVRRQTGDLKTCFLEVLTVVVVVLIAVSVSLTDLGLAVELFKLSACNY